MEFTEKLKKQRLFLIYTATDLDCLEQLEAMLVENYIKLIEVTFRSELVIPAIKKLTLSGNLLVEAGTVRTSGGSKTGWAVKHGAKF